MVSELDAKLDEKKPNRMDTPEFDIITKQKVGHRLREVLNGKSRATRTEKGVFKAYEFNEEKLKRIAKKYSCELVTKLPMLPIGEGASTPQTMEKVHENNVENVMSKGEGNGYIGNTVTNVENIKAVVALEPTHIGPCSFCGKRVTLTWQVQYFNGEWADVCLDCGTPLLEKVKAQSD